MCKEIRSTLIPTIFGAVTLAAAFAQPASADIIFFTGNQQDVGVNFASTDPTALLIEGEIGVNSNVFMTVGPAYLGGLPPSGTQQTLHASHGAASVSNANTSAGFDTLLLQAFDTNGTSLTTPQLPWYAGDFKLDLSGSTDTSVTFEAFDSLGNALAIGTGGQCVSQTATTCTMALDATGQAPFNFNTQAGETVSKLLITIPVGFTLSDIKQISLATNLEQIPLPSTLSLFGAGLGILGLLSWRKNSKAAL